jgi:hypothetical protein
LGDNFCRATRRQLVDEFPQRARCVGVDNALLGAHREVGDSFWRHIDEVRAIQPSLSGGVATARCDSVMIASMVGLMR